MIRALLIAAALLPLPAAAQQAGTAGSSTTSRADEPMAIPRGYRKVWSDEFDRGTAPDPRKWRYDVEHNRTGWPNNELEYYSDNRRENARIENGRLIIEARRERLADRPDFGGQDYTSARLITQGLASWTNGFVTVRAKLACGNGVWPAIWMLGTDSAAGWPALGEIDIMEHVGWDKGRIHGTIHTKAYNHVLHTQKGADTMAPDACDAFHDYQLDWNQDRLLIGMDGRAYMRFDNDRKGDPATWPFAKSEFLILNVAVGGWGSQQGGVDPNAFPSRMEVEYVRVYQKK
jgi:beta-glucanase (GH16 family)